MAKLKLEIEAVCDLERDLREGKAQSRCYEAIKRLKEWLTMLVLRKTLKQKLRLTSFYASMDLNILKNLSKEASCSRTSNIRKDGPVEGGKEVKKHTLSNPS
ncbi:MAG: hypothetical protein ABSH06_05120 [Thermodesulfobacteriota bacterium]